MGSVDDDLDARISKLRRDIDDFVKDNKLDERVGRIMQNMHPLDVQKVIKINFPDDCRSPSGFVVAQIRKAESEAGRPKDYRWDGRSFSEQSRDRGRRDGGRRTIREERRHGRSRSRSRRRRRRDDSYSDSRSPPRRRRR
ncbi:Alpha/beta hydrolase domain-containing protein 13 [Durusdinium trenchii]|uniref:Alpha/beta hydrolase domain-containing protein 13 n=1 Tax=Durusdinium trenchii TaxID=1381693 RepID=A0ABP0MRW9_9DINO